MPWAALSAFLPGYRIFRSYAKRVGIKPKELDDRIAKILRTWLGAMAQAPKDSRKFALPTMRPC